MGSMIGSNSQGHIKRFLRDHPDGHLYVMVGFASVWGLAWLQENTRGRTVTVVIGDTKKHRFQIATDTDRRRALEFLRRKDVRVLNWYQTSKSSQGASVMHAKGWIVADSWRTSATVAMIGSANLTREGLQNNWEMMALVADHELPRLWSQVDGFLKGRTVNRRPWDVIEKLTETIQAGGQPDQPVKPPSSQQTRRAEPPSFQQTRGAEPPPEKRKAGCFLLVATVGAAVAGLTVALLFLF